ncbi:patatin-like phospholipase family protein [Billgrantia saliphila]|uniref:patatin-like phospholipase family protein n=1 Tax=Billgrantia saliphila TaxID=1848458 RepID=UPI000CE342AE|nr:patatin-like phospholipase family protein [Halomonas saliphila]
MQERILLVLNGGGALGAYQCGVYRTLVRHYGAEVLRRTVIVGASIGAVNGFLIAAHHHQPDSGLGTLERFWREVAQPSVPFLPFPETLSWRLNATLTGLTWGNPPVFHGVPGGFLAGLTWYPAMAGYDNRSLVETTRRYAEEYSPKEAASPRLMIRAIDIEAATPAWFDSADQPIVPTMLGASSAIPLLFQPGRHAGRAYWDGDVWHQGLLLPALRRLLGEEPDQRLHVITVELFKRSAGMPSGFGQSLDHFRRLFLGARSDDEAEEATERYPSLRLTRIRRAPHPGEEASLWLMDWGADRLAYLLEQGEQDAERALNEKQSESETTGNKK